MLNKFSSVFIIIFFVCISVLEAREIHVQVESSNKVTFSSEDNSSDSSNSILDNEHCDDCHDDGCSAACECCHHFCSSTSLFYTSSKAEISGLNGQSLTKKSWYFYNNYKSPQLAAAFKPPLFS